MLKMLTIIYSLAARILNFYKDFRNVISILSVITHQAFYL